jgi:hypothetical protein
MPSRTERSHSGPRVRLRRDEDRGAHGARQGEPDVDADLDVGALETGSGAAELARDTCSQQGVPLKVVDPGVVRTVATLFGPGTKSTARSRGVL